MPSIPALLFLSEDKEVPPRSVAVDPDQPQELEKLALNHAPLALVVRVSDLDYFREMTDLVTDVGTKAKGTGLADYMVNKGLRKAPLMEAHYKKRGVQSGRSIRELLKNAIKEDESNLFIIGVPGLVFAHLSEGAVTDEGQPGGQGPSDPNSCSPLDLVPVMQGEDALKDEFLGKSHQHTMVRRLIMYAAQSREPVLILGETGTGKDLVARLIHEMSSFSYELPMMSINCACLPGTLIEAELFGYVKGAFTGADTDKTGIWEAAGEGLLFLDEIGDMPLTQQAKLLRALREGRIRKVGGTKDIEVKARVVAATNRNIYSMLKTGEFRDDLYYRLRGFLIRTPPIRKHPETIPLLVEKLWEEIAGNSQRKLNQAAIKRLQAHHWRGNVGEMKHFLGNLYKFTPGKRITENHITACFRMLEEGDDDWAEPSVTAKPEDLILHRSKCLGHLKLVEETLAALAINLNNIAAAGKPATLAPLRDELRRNAADLLALCEPKLRVFFYGEHTKDAICALSDRTFRFSCGLAGESSQSLSAWAAQTAREVDQAERAIFREIAGITKQGR